MNKKWIDRFRKVAKERANWSKDTTKVGCVIVSAEEPYIDLSYGYNGPPHKVCDSEDRFIRPKKYLFCAHAEQNAITFAAREGIKIKDASLFTTHHPCSRCTQMIINAGISCVYIDNGKTNMPEEEFEASKIMFDEAGLKIVMLDEIKPRWIHWNGGECPVTHDTMVIVETRGCVQSGYKDASQVCWQHNNNEDDIINYCVIKLVGFKLENGKFYITDEGSMIGPIYIAHQDKLLFSLPFGSKMWKINGEAYPPDSHSNIIALAMNQNISVNYP
jgi:dCMP deaminase